MKKLLLFVWVLGTFLTGFTQSTDTRSLRSFDRVSAAEGVEVFLTAGSVESARIEASRISVEDVLTEVSGGKLSIHLEGNNHRNVDVKVYVTYKELSGLSASSAASIKVEDDVDARGNFDIGASSAGSVSVSLSAESVDIDVSSSGDVNAEVRVAELDAEMSSAGDIDISGTAKYAAVSGSSSGGFDGYDFVCDEADLRVSSGASIKITVNEKLDGRASSGGSIRYKGAPSQVNANSSSGGSVRKS